MEGIGLSTLKLERLLLSSLRTSFKSVFILVCLYFQCCLFLCCLSVLQVDLGLRYCSHKQLSQVLKAVISTPLEPIVPVEGCDERQWGHFVGYIMA